MLRIILSAASLAAFLAAADRASADLLAATASDHAQATPYSPPAPTWSWSSNTPGPAPGAGIDKMPPPLVSAGGRPHSGQFPSAAG